MPSAKKYKLFASTDDGKPRPCAFFASPDGCKNGSNCKFEHVLPNNVISDNGSVVSSESEEEGQHVAAVKPEQETLTPNQQEEGRKKKTKKERKNKRKLDVEQASIFAKPKHKTETPTSSNGSSSFSSPNPAKKARKSEKPSSSSTATQASSSSSSQPAFAQLDLPIASFSTTQTPTPTPLQNPSTPSFRDLNLPIASFVTPTDNPLPMHTPTGRKWLKAVEATRNHPKYSNRYDFAKYQKNSTTDDAWIRAKPFGDWCKDNPQAIAMDCEMCETKDPVTGRTNTSALCRISIVNADEPSQVLLDTLVKPDWPVTDYRSDINGIEEQHLKDVKFTLQHAQQFMLALCSEETILMGHALHNDLAALRMQHYCNVDSACLFSVKDESYATIALRDLTMGVLNEPMPNIHDSVNDARMAFRCLQYYQERGGQVEPVPRHYPPRHKSGSNNNSNNATRNADASRQLYMHRIPTICKDPSLISDMFLEHTSVRPTKIDAIEFKQYGSTMVIFQTPRHMRLAFETLAETAEPDKSGRLQKKVFLANGSYVWVRKMVHERKDDNSNNTKK